MPSDRTDQLTISDDEYRRKLIRKGLGGPLDSHFKTLTSDETFDRSVPFIEVYLQYQIQINVLVSQMASVTMTETVLRWLVAILGDNHVFTSSGGTQGT